MADAVTRFETELNTLSISEEDKTRIRTTNDTECRDLWVHFCDHMLRHLGAIGRANPDPEIQARITVLTGVVTTMRTLGMPAINDLEVRGG